MSVPQTEESWRKAYRIVSSRFPPLGIFDGIANPADLETIYYVESLTNPRIREALGQIERVHPDDRISGPGTTAIMAAFTHLNPSGSRFSDGEFGVYYAANTQKTAIAETVFHTARWAKESSDPPTSFVMRVYIGRLNKRFYHDLRGQQKARPDLFDPDPVKYAPAQQFATRLRDKNSWGLIYHSVRNVGGECIAVFRPPALGVINQGGHLAYCWDGQKITNVLALRSLPLPQER